MGKQKDRQPKKAAAAQQPSNWWSEVEEVPRAGLPDAKKLTRRQRFYRWWIWVSLALVPLALLTVLGSLGSSGATVDNTGVDPYADTKARAIVEVTNWLNTSPRPLPGGSLVGWESATSKSEDNGSPKDKTDDYKVEVHHLTVADSNGNLYDTTVSLAVSDAIGTTVLGEPSLVPEAPSDDSFEGSDWPGLDVTGTSDAMTTAVTTWAEAYSSGDPVKLRQVISDQNETRNYVPLTGPTLTNASLVSAVGKPQKGDALDKPSRVIVRATFEIHWPGEPEPDAGASWPTVSYDLLLDHADGASPVVVAWGGPGTGPSLKPYVTNAVEGREVKTTNPSADASPAADSTATTTGEEVSP